jgi:hypothetical protein
VRELPQPRAAPARSRRTEAAPQPSPIAAATRQPFATAVSASSLRKMRPTGSGKSIFANSSRKTSMKPPTSDVPPAQAMSIGYVKLGMFWPDSKRVLMFCST